MSLTSDLRDLERRITTLETETAVLKNRCLLLERVVLSACALVLTGVLGALVRLAIMQP